MPETIKLDEDLQIVDLESLEIEEELFFKISNSDKMRPFFMSIVNNSNHWLFVSSNGGISAGRINPEYSLFPYYTDDKITESTEITGSKSIFFVHKNSQQYLWEPMSIRSIGKYNTTQNLYKSQKGNKIIFEEINHDLELVFRYQWCTSHKYGFVRKAKLINTSEDKVKINLLDGIQNIIPAGVGSYIQNQSSNLVDAYKRSEIDNSSGLGIYALSAILVDKAEASEALKANVVCSKGLENAKHLLSSNQLDDFRLGRPVHPEEDIKAEKCAYFLSTEIMLDSLQSKKWEIIANVNLNHSQVAQLIKDISEDKNIYEKVQDDILRGANRLSELIASSDGIQCTNDNLRDTRHFSNTMFNVMRGGIFDNNYQIERWDFTKFISNANIEVSNKFENLLNDLPEKFSLFHLRELAEKSKDVDFKRLCFEYMPLRFSRRHGDPSRPWNKFSINTRSEVDGSKVMDYEGNWRDIFQNWEALVHSFPMFIESMIHKFLNASTLDGYNPYRITKDGYDWEVIEPDNPWSYIGYWGDHQIIYLLKLLEFFQMHKPNKLAGYFSEEIFVYANVPYKIKEYKDILKSPQETIDFDLEGDTKIREKREKIGSDGGLLVNQKNEVVRVNLIEKILVTTLAKLSNFVPEGGIWMNTQRPEWNDANNALVGNGMSMVTLYYLRRFLKFTNSILKEGGEEEIKISKEIRELFDSIRESFLINEFMLKSGFSDGSRKVIVDSLGQAASEYRTNIYKNSFSGNKVLIEINEIIEFYDLTLSFLEHSIEANKRADGMYHSYNLISINRNETISVFHLSEMLEGQVAILSSGFLKPEESLNLLDSLKCSKLFRQDQYSYLLYPNKNIKGFMERNYISKELVESCELFKEMLKDGNTRVVEKDVNGDYHFNGNFKNVNDLKESLMELSKSNYQNLINLDFEIACDIFESVFNHKEFTGRSGTFFGYEGLGSIYWHMVSKLLLAVQECSLDAIKKSSDKVLIGKLLEHYYEINEGIGVHKNPKLYGACPMDPYSHTPFGRGAQQPGMTGQVKEDIISRFGELGVFIEDGRLFFNPCLLRKNEFLSEPKPFKFNNIKGEEEVLQLSKGSLGFTYCQLPIVFSISDQNEVQLIMRDGEVKEIKGFGIDSELSDEIFNRTGEVTLIRLNVEEKFLK